MVPLATQTYWAVIGDVVHSRAIAQRHQFQKQLEAVLATANERFPKGLVARWIVTAGDEFQALYDDPWPLPEVVEYMLGELAPVRIRFGIGHGTLATELRPYALGMDGPCFHAARLALVHAKRRGKVVVVADRHEILSLVSDIWDLAAKVVATRTPAQREAIAAYRRLRNQYEVAEQLGVTQGTISSHLSRGLFLEIQNVFHHIRRLTVEITAAGRASSGGRE